jgi:hypothetical protein
MDVQGLHEFRQQPGGGAGSDQGEGDPVGVISMISAVEILFVK